MSKLCYMDMSQYKLCYDNQMDFKRWAKHHGSQRRMEPTTTLTVSLQLMLMIS